MEIDLPVIGQGLDLGPDLGIAPVLGGVDDAGGHGVGGHADQHVYVQVAVALHEEAGVRAHGKDDVQALLGVDVRPQALHDLLLALVLGVVGRVAHELHIRPKVHLRQRLHHGNDVHARLGKGQAVKLDPALVF